MKIDYVCKFCRKPGTVSIGDSPVETDAARRWSPMLCCNRCGEFRVKMRKVRATLVGIAVEILSSHAGNRNEVITKARTRIELITKRIATLVCDYYRVQNIWEQDFVEQIIEQPNRADLVVAGFVSGVASFAKLPSQNLPALEQPAEIQNALGFD